MAGVLPHPRAHDGKQIAEARVAHPGAPVLVHPECPAVRDAADAVLSTGGMCRHVLGRPETAFIIGTETGILHRLQKENPGKCFYPFWSRRSART